MRRVVITGRRPKASDGVRRNIHGRQEAVLARSNEQSLQESAGMSIDQQYFLTILSIDSDCCSMLFRR